MEVLHYHRDLRSLIRKLFHFIAVLDFVNKNLCRFEAGDIMLINDNGGIAGNVAGDLFLPLFIDKAAKSPDVNILSAGHRGFNNVKERFNGMRYIGFVYSGLFSYLCDYVCFCHVG